MYHREPPLDMYHREPPLDMQHQERTNNSMRHQEPPLDMYHREPPLDMYHREPHLDMQHQERTNNSMSHQEPHLDMYHREPHLDMYHREPHLDMQYQERTNNSMPQQLKQNEISREPFYNVPNSDSIKHISSGRVMTTRNMNIGSDDNLDCKLIFHNNACLKLNNNNGLISDFCRLGNKQAFCLHPVENRNDNYQIKPYNNQDLCLSMNIISPELTSCNNQENTLWNADPL